MAEQSSADFRGNLGRYALFGEIAAGGMATVHLARLLGPVGFARTVAIKRLHPHLARDPEFVSMFLEEARLAARVRHPNVVATLDVVSEDGELFLVMEYVAGESLSRLVRKTRESGRTVPPRIVVGVLCGALEGLHAAHEATSEKGQPLLMVHRDVSPQNIHVGVDGVPRVLDFGIAKATNRVQETRTDQIKGKVAYMSPEQLAKGPIDRRADVYSASVVLWEALTGQRLFKADDLPSLVYAIVNDDVRAPSEIVDGLPHELDAIVRRGLDHDPQNRWTSAREMAAALEDAVAPAPPREIGAWVESVAGDALAWRMELVQRIERETSSSIPPPVRRDSPAPPIETSGVVMTDVRKLAGGGPGSTMPLAQPPPGLAVAPPPFAGPIGQRSEASAYADDASTGSLDAEEEAPASSLWLVGVAVVGLLLVAGGVLIGMRWMQLQAAEASAPALVTGGGPSSAHSSESAIVIGVPRTAVPVAASGASAAASSAVSTAAAPPPPAPSPRATVPITRKGASVHDDCDPPFTVDSRGGRHPKAHCARK